MNSDFSSHPQKLLNFRRANEAKAGPEHVDEAIKASFDDWVLSLSAAKPCGGSCGKHGCTQIFTDTEIRHSVVRYLMTHGDKQKDDRYQTLIDWVRSARALGGGHKNSKLLFPVPYCPSIGEELSNDATNSLRTHKLCLNVIQSLFMIGKTAWRNISNQSSKSAYVTPHGNTGKKRKSVMKADGEKLTALRSFMTKVESLGVGEPRVPHDL